jgi:hypothetical protein
MTRRLLHALVALYPPAFRRRYGRELHDLVDELSEQESRRLVGSALGLVGGAAREWWQRSLPWEGCGLSIVDAEAFAAAHAARVAELGLTVATGPVPEPAPLVFTHGDPGPGNYLDDGLLLDFESATVAPRGLDIGRAMFIALLGSGPEGWIARDPAARSRAVGAGYLAALGSAWRPGAAELRWWLTASAGCSSSTAAHSAPGLPACGPPAKRARCSKTRWTPTTGCPRPDSPTRRGVGRAGQGAAGNPPTCRSRRPRRWSSACRRSRSTSPARAARPRLRR